MLLLELFSPPISPALLSWFGDSKVVDSQGRPLVLYHGTGAEFDDFDRMVWGSVSPRLANDYAELRGNMGGEANVIPIYMRLTKIFDADRLPGTVTVDSFFTEVVKQSGQPASDQIKNLVKNLKRAAREEESGPHYSREDFWYNASDMFGRDSVEDIEMVFYKLGYDGIKMTEHGDVTYGAFSPTDVRSAIAPGLSEKAPPASMAPKLSPAFKAWFGDSKIVDKKGNPLPVFHGTDKDFSSFDASMTGDIGIHFGNAAQASAAVYKHWDREQRYKNDSRLIPVFLRIEKPLYVKDTFSTMNNTWRGRAKNFGLDSGLIFNNEEHKELWSTAETLDKMRRKAGNSYSMILDKKNDTLREEYDSLSKQFWNLIERVARRNGFDGMIYQNRAEGKGPSYIIFDPNQAKSVFNVGTWDNEKHDIGESLNEKAPPEAFAKWFKNSVVTNPDGTPMRVYHGTMNSFSEFCTGSHFGDAEAANVRLNNLAKDPPRFRGNLGTIMPVYLSIQNPLRIIDDAGLVDGNDLLRATMKTGAITQQEYDEIRSKDPSGWRPSSHLVRRRLFALLQSHGYDGFVYKNTVEGSADSWIPFSPNQVKSVFNKGSWDSGKEDIGESSGRIKNDVANFKKNLAKRRSF